MPHLRWDSELMRRYRGVSAPLVGSPDPMLFRETTSSFELLHALRDSRQRLRPLALNVYLPHCTEACHHCSRTRVPSSNPEEAQPYLDGLGFEIERLGRHLDPRQRVERLCLSGGSPTFLRHAQLRQLMASLHRHFNISDSPTADLSVEIDPRQADWSTIGLLRELGFNRLHLRVDALDPQVQQAINRHTSLAATRTLVEAARTLQFRSVAIELMQGLPDQTAARFANTLEQIIALQPDRLLLSEYRHRPERFPSQRQIDAALLPDANERQAIFAGSVERLQQAGYRYLGMNLFVLPDDDLAAAQEEDLLQLDLTGLSYHGGDVIGIGLSAISRIGALYSQNHTTLAGYRRSLANDQLPTWRGRLCGEEERLRQTLSRQLICRRQLCFSEVEQRFGLDLRSHFAAIWPQLERIAADGLIELDDSGLRLTGTGVLVADAVCQLFNDCPPAQASAADASWRPDSAAKS